MTERKMTGKIRKRVVKPLGTSENKKQKQVVEEEEKEASFRDWASGLPDHLIELIIQSLTLIDCLSFSNVCIPWRIITTLFSEESFYGIPLLVTNGHDETIMTKTCLNVLDNYRNSTFKIQLPEACQGSYIYGSSRDCLFLAKLVGCYIHFSILNPFSVESITLPKAFGFHHLMVVVSTVPTNFKCVYMLVSRRSDSVCFWTRGRLIWCKHSLDYGSQKVLGALYHEGKFYLLLNDCKLVIIDQKDVLDKLNEYNDDAYDDSCGVFSRCPRIESQLFSLGVVNGITYRTEKIYLVESCGDILLVKRIFHRDRPRRHKTSDIEIYRADFSQMVWVKMDNSGGQVLFLGEPSSRSFKTKELGDNGVANNIYFSNNYTWMMNDTTCSQDCFSCSHDYLKRRKKGDDWGIFSYPKAHRRPHVKSNNWPGIWLTAPIWWCSTELRQDR